MKTKEMNVWYSPTYKCIYNDNEQHLMPIDAVPAKPILPVEPEVVEFVEDCRYGKIISDNFKKLQGKRWKITATEVVE